MKQNSSSSNVSRCDVELDVGIVFSGEIVGGGTADVTPGLPNGETMYVQLTDWYSAAGANKAVAGFVVMNNKNANLDYQLAARTASDKNEPDDWTELEGSFTSAAAGNSERNTGEVALTALSPAIDAVQWIQLGVAVKATSTATIRATIHGACGIVQTH